MSRRQRKKTNSTRKEKSQGGGVLKGLWWKLLIGFVVLLIVGGFIAYNKVVSFLHSDEFRDDVATQVGAELGSKGDFGDFKWDGLSAKNESFKAKGEGAIVSVDVEDIALDVKLDYLKRDKFRLKNVVVGSVDTVVDLREEFMRLDRVKKEKGFLESLLPEEVELLDAEIYEFNASVRSDSGEYKVTGVNLQVEKVDDSYEAIVEGGLVRLPFAFLSSARIEQGEFVQLDHEIYVKDTKLRIFESGEIVINGDIDLSPSAQYLYDMKGKMSGLLCKDVFPDEWHRHLSGEVGSEFTIKPYQGSEPKIKGSLDIKNGILQALPVLNQMSRYLSEARYRTLRFEEFVCKFEKFRDEIILKDIILSSSGLLKIEGDLKINGESLDGLFDVGLPASYLARIPGARNRVFKPGKDDLLWAKVRVGGDLDNMTQDLTDRLIKAATNEVIDNLVKVGGDVVSPEVIDKLMESGEALSPEAVEQLLENGKVLSPETIRDLMESSKGVLESLGGVLKGDRGVIEGGVDTAKGILEGITGSGKEEKGDDAERKDGGIIPELPKVEGILPFL